MPQPLPEPHDEISQLVAERMARLSMAFRESLRERAVSIERALRQCETAGLNSEQRCEIRALAHNLAGSGTTYGYPRISERARLIDDHLRLDLEMPAIELRDLISALLVVCRTALGLDEIRNPPVRRPAFGRRPARLALAEVIEPRKPRLLVVDDDPAIRDLFMALLSTEADIVTAVNSDEALRMIRLYHPDLVLLDDIMPGAVTGLTFLENLKVSGEFPDLQVVMITASNAPEHVTRGLAAGAADYITKPFIARKVIADIRRRLQRTRGLSRNKA